MHSIHVSRSWRPIPSNFAVRRFKLSQMLGAKSPGKRFWGTRFAICPTYSRFRSSVSAPNLAQLIRVPVLTNIPVRQPNQAQALAITKAAAVCLRRGGARPLAKRDKEGAVVQDLQNGGHNGEGGSDSDKGELPGDERLLKGYMVGAPPFLPEAVPCSLPSWLPVIAPG